MARKSARLTLTTADRVLSVLQTRTQKQAARYLNVSERTVRRWKNEGVEPTRPHRQVLVKKSGIVRRSVQRAAKREGARVLGGAVPLPVKRVMKLDPRDPQRKRRIKSDTLFYDISESSRARILATLKSLRGTNVLFRFVMDLRPGKPDSMGKVHKKKFRYSTAWSWIDMAELESDAEMLEILDAELETSRPVYLVVGEQKRPRKRQRK